MNGSLPRYELSSEERTTELKTSAGSQKWKVLTGRLFVSEMNEKRTTWSINLQQSRITVLECWEWIRLTKIWVVTTDAMVVILCLVFVVPRPCFLRMQERPRRWFALFFFLTFVFGWMAFSKLSTVPSSSHVTSTPFRGAIFSRYLCVPEYTCPWATCIKMCTAIEPMPLQREVKENKESRKVHKCPAIWKSKK